MSSKFYAAIKLYPMPKLGVNIDHVATLRQARRGTRPDPIEAAKICERAGAHSIVAHLREDRRHINDDDIKRLKKTVRTRLNLEMSINDEIVKIACMIKPDQATLVPEKRQEITTEGGLDIVKGFQRIKNAVKKLQAKGILVSLFIDPDRAQLERSREIVTTVELHTGCYAEASTLTVKARELEKLKAVTALGLELDLTVNAGHGLKYHDVRPVARIIGIHELNIGHSIISRALVVGIAKAVREMKELIK